MPYKKKILENEEEKVVDEVVEETVGDANKDRIERKPPKYRVIRCDAASLEKNLNSIGDIHRVWKILVEPSYNGAFFNIIYIDFDDEE